MDKNKHYNLTRREKFAMAALTGVVINHWTDRNPTDLIVRETIKIADALILELDREGEK